MSKRLAMKFHEIYERLAPRFGYETRTETRAFDPTTPNGRLMIAVTDEIEDYHLDFNKALEEDYCALHQENDRLRAELTHLTAELAMQKSLVAAREQDLNELHIALSQLREYTLKNENIIRDLRERTRWIPVSERLPKYMERVVFFGGGEMTTHIGYYVPELPQWTAEDGGYFHGKNAALITHWMNLPTPPEDNYVGDSDHEHDDRIL